jgi:hypothetical protein
MLIEWSGEIPFEEDEIGREVPDEIGVYQILQHEEYPRYVGKTRILRIGKSDSSLRQEILNHFVRHTVANRLARIRNVVGISVTVVYATIGKDKTTETEKKLLRYFEDVHWDLPVLNSNRGYKRDGDKHYRRLPHRHRNLNPHERIGVERS